MRRLLWSVALSAVVPTVGGAQLSAPREITIRVVDSLARAIAGAQVVMMTSVQGDPSQQDTDVAGVATFRTPGGTGEYVISVHAVGFRSARRLVANREGAATLRAVFTLRADAARNLGAIVVRASRPEVERRFVYDVPPGNVEAVSQGANAAAPPVLARLDELLRNDLLFDGSGAAGLGSAATQTQLNGLVGVGSVLPRSAPVVVRGTVAEYDASVTGFSGGLIAAEIARASEYVERSGFVLFDALGTPLSSRAAAVRPSVSPEFAADLGGTTLLRSDRMGLSWGVRGQARQSAGSALEFTTPSVLAASGIEGQRLGSIIDTASVRGLLASPHRGGAGREVSGSLIGRVDWTREAMRTNAMVVALGVRSREPTGTDPLAALQLARGERDLTATAQHLWEQPGREGAVWRSRLGVGLAIGRDAGSPVIPADLSEVRVVPIPDELTLVTAPPVSVGSSGPATTVRRLSVDQHAERERRLGRTGAHQLKVFEQVRVTGLVESRSGADALVEFPSIDAFARAQNARVRIQGTDPGDATAIRAGIGFNDTWRVSSRVRLSFGSRVDYQQLTGGARTDRSRAQVVDVSPRVGLSWNLITPRTSPGFGQTNLVRRQHRPSGILRLGAGLFTADFNPQDAVEPGRSAAVSREVACRTDAITPRDGVGGSPYSAERLEQLCEAQRGSRVLLGTGRLDGSFAPSRSLRGTIGYSTRVGPVDLGLDAVVSRTTRLPQLLDEAVPRLALDSLGASGRRPFFAERDSIDAPSGTLQGGRVASGDAVARRYLVRSDLAAVTQRYVVTVQSPNNGTRWPFTAGYAWSRAVSRQGGFDNPTPGDPWMAQTRVSPLQRTHQFQFEIGHRFFDLLDVSWWSRVASGAAFVPLISGDVNGDGRRANDIFSAGDTIALEGGTGAIGLLGTPAARRCLDRVVRSAASTTCTGPWTLASALSVKLEFGSHDRFPRGQVALAIENPLGAISDAFREAASLPLIDPFVAQVRRYEPATGRFVLAGNPGFGRRLGAGAFGAGLPRWTLSVQVPLAPTVREQQVDRWFLRRGLGSRLSLDSVAVLFARNVPNLLDDVLEREDELALAPAQRDTIMALHGSLRVALAAHWRKQAGTFTDAHVSRDRKQLMERMQSVTDEAWEISRRAANPLEGILSPLQQSLLSRQTVRLMRARSPIRIPVIYF